MPIIRCSEQSGCTLEEFYVEWRNSENLHSSKVGEGMLALLNAVNPLFQTTTIWGLTSHAHLLLQTVNDSASNYFVIVTAGFEDYYFEYVMPTNRQPWPNALVKGSVKTVEEAINYWLIAMRESQGWHGNAELQKLLSERGL